MAAKIISFICYMLCAIPFWVIAKHGKNGQDPISFWTGDTSLKDKVKDVAAYNREMAALYTAFGWVFFVAAVGSVVHPLVGVGIAVVASTVGIFVLYRVYKKILAKYS